MKKTTKLLALLASAFLAMSLVSCDDPKDTSDSIVLFESETGWSEDWKAKDFTATDVADATNDSAIYMVVSKDTDRLIDNTQENQYAECYTLIQILKYDGTDGKFGEGTATGATIKDASQLEGMFQDSDPNTKFYTVSYKPTAEEWTNMKTNGFGIQAHGTMFKKIEIK